MNLTFLSPNKITHEVNGQELEFRALSIPRLFQVKAVIAPIVRAIVVLTSNSSRDNGQKVQTFNGADGGQVIDIDPVPLETTQFRINERAKAIEDILEAISRPQTQKLAAETILWSIGEEPKEAQSFLDNCDASTLWELLQGVAKANQRGFEPFLGRISTAANEVREAAEAEAAKGPRPMEAEESTPSSTS